MPGNWGQGFRISGSGSRVQGFGFGVSGSGFRVQGLGFTVRRGFRGLGVQAFRGLGVQGVVFRMQGLGFRQPDFRNLWLEACGGRRIWTSAASWFRHPATKRRATLSQISGRGFGVIDIKDELLA